METNRIKKFAQYARRSLIEQVSAKLKLVLAENSAARRESVGAIENLDEAINKLGKEQVIERVAYIWFNRFCALRFMDVNRYTRIGVVSPAEGQSQPEILAEAKMGHIDEEFVSDKIRNQIFALLEGKAPSSDPQSEAYRLLVVGACNQWNRGMPFLFERIDDYTELLMPDDLLSGNSILAYTREAMTPDVCQDVEVIGWLYQFYISEKKDEVFAELKKNKKITPENIPAATQLFTPHWIVRYLVENSLGRLWMLNRTDSKLIEKMDYYIQPKQPETDFLRIGKPEEIKICDPACGSGHMLTYAFDLLHAIYEEEGYEPAEIPEKILTHNLYGIEIDERAGELAALALTMKACVRQRRFFRKPVQPNICVLENVQFDEAELKNYMDFVGRDLFTTPLHNTLNQFEEADNFGSLIRPEVTDVGRILKILASKNVSGNLFLSQTHQKVLRALQQADYLSPKYHVVIANPPYMGGKGMNSSIKVFLQTGYKDAKADLFSAFLLRNMELIVRGGFLGFVTPYVWMFISTYEKVREYLLSKSSVNSLIQLEYNAFEPACVPVCTFVLEKRQSSKTKGHFIKLSEFKGYETQALKTLEAIRCPGVSWRYTACTDDFRSIPGSAFAYWLSDKAIEAFTNGVLLKKISSPKQGLATTDNKKYIRCWFELPFNRIAFGVQGRSQALESGFKWFPYNKGGDYRRWYGNNDFVVNWKNDGEEIKKDVCTKYPYLNGNPDFVTKNQESYFKEGITWTYISNAYFGVRYSPSGFIFDVAGSSVFPEQNDIYPILSFMSSVVANYYIGAINPTMNIQAGNVGKLPVNYKILSDNCEMLSHNASELIEIAKRDWDSLEKSWEFTRHPLLNYPAKKLNLGDSYKKYRVDTKKIIGEVISCENKNNNFFVNSYRLIEELTTDLPLSAVTLNCNPHYRYGGDKNEEELEALLLADTMRELISYAVGCMFGRYALEKPGLILANQGETIDDYLKRVPKPSFPADDDNVIPMLDGDWFTDDIAERFRKFLRVAFGEEHYEDNLKFIEKALGKDGKAREIRDYFLKDFYNDHVRRYKKRPIYWLFSSPKGCFNALIYMHRYRPDTVSVVLNDYLREFRAKLTSHKNHVEAVSISASASQGEKTKALKEIEKIRKMIAEMEEYEREVLYPLATEQVEIDLDDGVKVNYPKFGAALKKFPGLSVME